LTKLTVFDKEDPNTKRNSKVKRVVSASVRCYSKIMKARKMKASQKPLDSFGKTTKRLNCRPQSTHQLSGYLALSAQLSTTLALPPPPSPT
jgi:hypothetical protein